MMVKLGLIGCGRIGTLHAKNLKTRVPGVELVAVSDVNLESARRLASELGLEKATADYRELLRMDLDGVLVCTSTETHREIVVAASEAGKHIFCEKPLARDLKEVDEMLEAVRKGRVKLQVGFNRRFDPNISALKAQIPGLGRPLLLKITSRDPDFPPFEYLRVSGGIWVDMTIHDFDMARFLMGEVEEVYSTGSVLLEPRLKELGDLDTVVTVLRFESGALGVIDNCRRAVYGYDQRVEVLGERGMVEVPNLRPVSSLRHDETGTHLPKMYHFFPDRYELSFVEEMRAFVRCIQTDMEPPVTGEDGKKALVLALLAQRSFQEGRPLKVG